MATLLLTLPLSSPITGRIQTEFRSVTIRPAVSVSQTIGSVSRRPNSRFSRLRVSCEAKNNTTEVPEVTDDSWQSLVLDSASPVLVEFWAPWCGPCRMIHPIIDQLAKEYAGKLNCYKVNTDNSPTIASRYGVRSVPTVIIFKNGEKKDTVIGAVPKPTLISSVDRFI